MRARGLDKGSADDLHTVKKAAIRGLLTPLLLPSESESVSHWRLDSQSQDGVPHSRSGQPGFGHFNVDLSEVGR